MKIKNFIKQQFIIIIFCIVLIILSIPIFSRLKSFSQAFSGKNLEIKSINIMNSQIGAELYPVIEVICNQTIKDGAVKIIGVNSKTFIDKNKLICRPECILRPVTKYNVRINIKGYIKTLTKDWYFITKELDETTQWIEVALTQEQQKVYIRQGKNKLIKEMICSGGTKDQPTIMGTYYLQNRGNKFFSERFNEGALYWIRIKDQYLFHSIPRDRKWNIIKEELEKIGKPASHGCIRLIDDDAKWVYENIEDKTMVIIHD